MSFANVIIHSLRDDLLVAFCSQIGSLKGYYLFAHPHVHKRSTTHSEAHADLLKNEDQVSDPLFLIITVSCRVRRFVVFIFYRTTAPSTRVPQIFKSMK